MAKKNRVMGPDRWQGALFGGDPPPLFGASLIDDIWVWTHKFLHFLHAHTHMRTHTGERGALVTTRSLFFSHDLG